MTITLPVEMGDRIFAVGRNADPDFANGDESVITLTLELRSPEEARLILGVLFHAAEEPAP